MDRIVILSLMLVCVTRVNYILPGLTEIGDYRTFTVLLSVLVGYFAGKSYSRLRDFSISLETPKSPAPEYDDDGKIQKYLTNGAYNRNFQELEYLNQGVWKVRHILEKKEYSIQKLNFSQSRWEDLVKKASECSKQSDYVTSWVESEGGAYTFFTQYC